MRFGRTLANACLVLLALLALPGAPAGAEDGADGFARQLSKARFQEFSEHDYAQALELYDALLMEQDLEPAVRGRALLGKSRCLVELGRREEAVKIWERIAAEKALPEEIRQQAETKHNADVAQRGREETAASKEDAFRRRQAEREQSARDTLDRARRKFDAGQYEAARSLCLAAKAALPDFPEADELLDKIIEAMPDQGELLRQLLRFADTTWARELSRFKDEIERLHTEGREHYQADELPAAAESFRKAIRLIDESDYLTELLNERERTLGWLRKTIQDGEARGLDLGEEPAMPDPFEAAPDWRRDLHALLGRMFTNRTGEEDPLVVYEVRPGMVALDAKPPSLAPGPFPKGMTVTRTEGTLSRAWWAERWIRDNVGTGWGEAAGAMMHPSVLDRFGDVLIVQNDQATHRKVRRVLDEFSPLATPVVVDVAVVASTTAGGVQLATQLGLAAKPGESGADLVASNRLFQESLDAVKSFEGLELLGTTRITLTGDPRALVAVTRRAEDHPNYQDLPNPPLQLTPKQARYGLFLDLYAEDLSRAEGTRRAAIGVVATTRVPQGTDVVHLRGARTDYERVPKPMAEQHVAAAQVVPHAGTFVVQGLSNPFPESATNWPGLTLLFAVRPADDGRGRVPMPDPDREKSPGEAPTGNGPEEREYELGSLATEVDDAVLVEGWPRRPFLEPVSPAAAQRARERYLETQLGLWSKLAAPGQPSPVRVDGAVASATLTPEQHAQLRTAVQALRDASTTLYEVNVLTAEVAEETLANWMRDGKAVSFTPGTYLVTSAEDEQAFDARMRAEGMRGGLYAMNSRLLARATQKVAAHNLRAFRIVQDLRFWRHTDGTMRYIPVYGIAEEGIAVLVRPEIDNDGRRMVVVEAQAARLRDLETVALPNVEVPGGRVTVARHHPVQSRRAAAPLTDTDGVLLTLPAPEGTGRVIVVKVNVKRLQ